MNAAEFSDFPRHTRPRTAAVPPDTEQGMPGTTFNQPAPDEVALMNILRFLNRVRSATALTPVEHAFILAAKAMFEELAKVCNDLLTPAPTSPTTTSPAAATPAAAPALVPHTDPAQPARSSGENVPAGRSRSSRRTNPGDVGDPQ